MTQALKRKDWFKLEQLLWETDQLIAKAVPLEYDTYESGKTFPAITYKGVAYACLEE